MRLMRLHMAILMMMVATWLQRHSWAIVENVEDEIIRERVSRIWK
jgi:hypothetical protein